MYKQKCRIIALVLSLSFSQVINPVISSANSRDIETSYCRVKEYSQQNGIPFSMELVDYENEYNEQNYESIDEYENIYFEMLWAENTSNSNFAIMPFSSSSSSGDSKYYYNTGTSCPAKASYSKYALTKTVQKGDIVYDGEGGFGITHHVAIVEGIYTDNGKEYVRVIEAIDKGVKRGILDDTRVDERKSRVFRVNTSDANKLSAVSFCKKQLGKSYKLDLAKDTSENEEDWYCSELVRAAYKNAGINIETTGKSNQPGVTPNDITIHGKNVGSVCLYK